MAATKRQAVALFVTVLVFCWFCLATCLSSDVAALGEADCRPQRKMTKAGCAARIRRCTSLGINLKWTGKGCRQGKTIAGDGGCQCKNYCGYTCKQACNGDRMCSWNSTQNQCFSRATGQPEEAQATCSNMSSSSPTSLTPISSAPTTTPTPSVCPTLSPTSSPTQFGQMLSGIQTNIPVPPGWSLCYCDTYDVHMTQPVVVSIENACTKTNLMLACRPIGNTNLTVAAMAPRVDVLTNTGTSNTPHDANGVGWYFSETLSWGFAAQGDSITRNACDLGETNPESRLCWHTGSRYGGGYRCGSAYGLNNDNGWVRLVYQAD